MVLDPVMNDRMLETMLDTKPVDDVVSKFVVAEVDAVIAVVIVALDAELVIILGEAIEI